MSSYVKKFLISKWFFFIYSSQNHKSSEIWSTGTVKQFNYCKKQYHINTREDCSYFVHRPGILQQYQLDRTTWKHNLRRLWWVMLSIVWVFSNVILGKNATLLWFHREPCKKSNISSTWFETFKLKFILFNSISIHLDKNIQSMFNKCSW